jgi:hypothetical protein
MAAIATRQYLSQLMIWDAITEQQDSQHKNTIC